MKGILGFLTVFLSITGLGTFYIGARATQAFSLDGSAQWVLAIVLTFLLFSYILAHIIDRNTKLQWLSDTLTWIGSIWLFLLAYFFLSVVAIDLLRLIDLAIDFLPDPSTPAYASLKVIAGWGVVSVVGISFIAGYINARYIRTKTLPIEIGKRSPHKKLTVIAASDFHLGVINSEKRTKQYVEKINRENPDIVLIAGDIMDGSLEPVARRNLGAILQQIRSKYGVFAVTGNHEYIGTVEPSVRYLEEHGIRILRDEVLEVEGLYIIGREDLSYNRAHGRERKKLSNLVTGLDHSKPLLMMDHQPFHLEDAEQNGIDFQLSGHSHHGQFWPINLITKRVYEVSWGYKKKSNTHVYVSCGAGTWGPPVRIGSEPEIMRVEMSFTA